MNFNDKSAFIAIIGRPNVGKSSILNKLLGQKVAIVSSKPQTTRTRIMGVLTEGKDQLVFLDTPGMHKPKNSLGDYMVRSINESVAGVDACLLVTEAGQEIRENERMLIEKVKKLDLPCVLAINKTDTINDKEVILEQIIKYSKEMDFDAIVPVSAETGSKLDELKEELKKFTSEGGHFFPVIFCGVSIGFGIGMLSGLDVAFCSAVVTAGLLGVTMKKPLAVTLLLLLCFDVNVIPWVLLSAFIGSVVPTKIFKLNKTDK